MGGDMGGDMGGGGGVGTGGVKTSSSLVARRPWPEHDPDMCVEDVVGVGVQINGKRRDSIDLPKDCTEDEARQATFDLPRLHKYLDGKEVKKFVYVPGRIINIVVA